MIKIGTKIQFDPWHNLRSFSDVSCTVVGTVIFVHPKHSYFTVEYPLGPLKTKFRTSFHFADVYGKWKCVKVIG